MESKALLDLLVDLGLIVEAPGAVAEMAELVEYHDWAYGQYEEEEARLVQSFPAAAKIEVTARGSFELCGDAKPLIAILRNGKADPELQRWIADQIECGGFKRRDTLMQHMKKKGPLADAIMELPDIERLMRMRVPARSARKYAVKIVAFHNEVHVDTITGYLRRSRKDPHRRL